MQTVTMAEGTVSEQFTGTQLLQLATNLLDDGNIAEALDVLKMGVNADAYRLAAMPVLARAAASGNRYDTSEAIGMIRYGSFARCCGIALCHFAMCSPGRHLPKQ
jgi:hypothetical protein